MIQDHAQRIKDKSVLRALMDEDREQPIYKRRFTSMNRLKKWWDARDESFREKVRAEFEDEEE